MGIMEIFDLNLLSFNFILISIWNFKTVHWKLECSIKTQLKDNKWQTGPRKIGWKSGRTGQKHICKWLIKSRCETSPTELTRSHDPAIFFYASTALPSSMIFETSNTKNSCRHAKLYVLRSYSATIMVYKHLAWKGYVKMNLGTNDQRFVKLISWRHCYL